MATVAGPTLASQQRAQAAANRKLTCHRSPPQQRRTSHTLPPALTSCSRSNCQNISSAGAAISGLGMPHANTLITARPPTEQSRRRPSVSAKAAPSTPEPEEGVQEPEDSPQPKKWWRAQLDSHPTLTREQGILCIAAAFLACVSLAVVHRPERPSDAIAFGSLTAGTWLGARSYLLEPERERRGLLYSERDLAGNHSRFCVVEGVDVHYKVESPQQHATAKASNVAAVALYHGFGASMSSWNCSQALLAARLRANVTAHDMPGFGLTKRPARASAYTLKFNGRLGRGVMEAELPAGGRNRGGGHVLIGHSLGAVSAALELISNPEGIVAIVLVAPAILAWPLGLHEQTADAAEATAPKAAGKVASFARVASVGHFIKRVRRTRNTALRLATVCTCAGVATALRGVLWLAAPALKQGMRGAVRSRAFWERALARAWHRKAGVTEAVVDDYRLPQLVKGWEAGMLNFLRASVLPDSPFGVQLSAAYLGYEALTQVEQLATVVARRGIRVLLVHGKNDEVVPIKNSRKLAKIIPGAEIQELDACGHNPQEEVPEEFVEAVAAFFGHAQ